MAGERSTLSCAFTWPVMRSSLIVAAIVGTILNLINQGDRLGGAEPIDWLKLGLTYCVPFCVSTWGSFAALRIMQRRAARGPR